MIGADALSRWVDWEDRNSCILFGDGAGAMVLEAAEGDDSAGLLGEGTIMGDKSFIIVLLVCRRGRGSSLVSSLSCAIRYLAPIPHGLHVKICGFVTTAFATGLFLVGVRV